MNRITFAVAPGLLSIRRSDVQMIAVYKVTEHIFKQIKQIELILLSELNQSTIMKNFIFLFIGVVSNFIDVTIFTAARDSINKLSQKDHQVKNWGFPNYVPARRGIPMHRMPLMETNQKLRLIHYLIP